MSDKKCSCFLAIPIAKYFNSFLNASLLYNKQVYKSKTLCIKAVSTLQIAYYCQSNVIQTYIN